MRNNQNTGTASSPDEAFCHNYLAGLISALILGAGYCHTATAQTADIVISTDQTSTMTLTKPGDSVLVENGVTINAGSSAALAASANDSWSIVNQGSLSGTYGYTTGSPGGNTVFNNATRAQINATQMGINYFGRSLEVRNDGQIYGGRNGIYFFSTAINSDMLGLTLTNSSLIQGGTSGINISQDYSMTSTITNLAGGRIIGGADGYGIVVLRAVHQINNQAGAEISGGAAGISGSDLTTQLDINNAGTITGIAGPGVRSYGGGTVTNLTGGLISGLGGVAMVRPVWNDTDIVDNAGTIQGTGTTFVDGNVQATGSGVGVYFGGSWSGAGAQVINRTGGLISGTLYGVYSSYTSAVSDVGPLSINNAGAIRGDVGIAASYGNAAIVNSGEITGSGGTAIRFDQTGNFINSLTLDTGSIINGNVLAGTGNQNSLTLQGSGSETLGKFIGFNSLTMQGDDWTLSGSATFTQQADVLSGSLRLNNAILTTPQFTVATGAVLAGAGTLSGDLYNHGTVTPSVPSGFGTLTVQGNYTGTDGQLTMNTALSDDSSATDKLIVTGDTSGTTYVTVNNAGGTGALTGNGIELIHVGGDSNGTFTQQGRIIADGYGYTLYKGSLSDPSDGNWYLRSVALPTPPTPDPDSGPIPKTEWVDPTVGAYLGNQTAAVNMFSHSLHDRLGEPQFTEANKTNGLTPSVWVRVIGSTQDSKATQQTLDLSTDTTVVQIGADLAQWSGTGNDRWHLGLMAGYGHSKTDASHPKDYGQDYLRNAKGTVDGYSIGVYATWYGNASLPSGPYVDTWIQYGWFDNDVSASGINTDSYKSRNLSASVEAGYAFTLSDNGSRQWMIEPQAQLIFNSYDVDDHVTSYGSKVHNADANGLTSRVGARLYSRPVAGNGVQPFVELNWLHGDAENSLQFGSNAFSHDVPEDRYEVKAGLQAKLSKNWHGWASVGWQTGNNDYQQLEGLAGVKYLW